MRCWRAGLLAAILPLSACLGEGTGGLSLLSPPEDSASNTLNAPVLETVSLFQGNVVVVGPKGYCIDRQSVRQGRSGGVILIASCESLTGERQSAVEPAVITVSVLPRQTDASQPKAAELAAEAGEDRVLHKTDGDGLSYVHLATGGDALLPEGDPRHWRGAMLVNGHVVGLAVYGAEGSPVAGALGATLLEAQAESIRSRSPERAFVPTGAVASDTVVAPDTEDDDQPAGLAGFLNELFPESN